MNMACVSLRRKTNKSGQYSKAKWGGKISRWKKIERNLKWETPDLSGKKFRVTAKTRPSKKSFQIQSRKEDSLQKSQMRTVSEFSWVAHMQAHHEINPMCSAWFYCAAAQKQGKKPGFLMVQGGSTNPFPPKRTTVLLGVNCVVTTESGNYPH